MKRLSSVFYASLCAENRLRIAALIGAKKKARDKKIDLFNYILHCEISTGTTFILTKPDRAPYIMIGLTSQAMYLPSQGHGSPELFAYLHQRYGLNEHEDLTKYVFDGLRMHTYQHGVEVELRRFAYFDKETNTQYISRYNGEVFKIEGSGVPSVVKNGEGVYFADDDDGKYCDGINIRPHGILIDTLTNLNFSDEIPGGISPELQQKALIVWLFALAFPDLMPTKPLMLFEGAPGSGKSSCSQFIQLALLGTKKPLIIGRSKEDDFGIMLLRNPISVLDNVDSYIDWIPDAVCAYTTSGVWTKRKLYTDNEEVTIRPHSFIAVASKNPASFRREDVADRSIIIRLKRIKKYRSQDVLEDAIMTNRGKILGEYLYYCNEITKRIKNGELKEAEATNEDEEETVQEQASHRMADYVALARIVSKVLGWDENAVDDLLAALQSERDNFVNEDDPLAELLHRWLNKRKGVNWVNYGRLVSLQELYHELEMIAEADNIVFYKSPRQLSQKMRSPNLAGEFDIRPDKIRTQIAYRIWKQSGPRPVEDEGEKGGNEGNEGNEGNNSNSAAGGGGSKSPTLTAPGINIFGLIRGGATGEED